MTEQERFEIEQDLRLNKTKDEIIESHLQVLEMLDQALAQTKRAIELAGLDEGETLQ